MGGRCTVSNTINTFDVGDIRSTTLVVETIRVEVFENHAPDARYRPLGDVCSTLAERLGTGGATYPW